MWPKRCSRGAPCSTRPRTLPSPQLLPRKLVSRMPAGGAWLRNTSTRGSGNARQPWRQERPKSRIPAGSSRRFASCCSRSCAWGTITARSKPCRLRARSWLPAKQKILSPKRGTATSSSQELKRPNSASSPKFVKSPQWTSKSPRGSRRSWPCRPCVSDTATSRAQRAKGGPHTPGWTASSPSSRGSLKRPSGSTSRSSRNKDSASAPSGKSSGSRT
mmetsp:Transcript_28401/g.88323  ORF Transcript_28401/g.88323 Transcript_28401/m.88323 type:complete len:217 (-) Transcript_28401:57-707(-)